jgi:large subunit ribosomal protein L6
VALPQGVSVAISPDNLVTIQGPKGRLEQSFPPDVKIELVANAVQVSRPSDAKPHKAMHGMTRALILNMVHGVSAGYSRQLDVEGVGYRAAVLGKNLVMFLGFSHPVELMPPPGVVFEVDKTGRLITISGIDKQLVGQMAAQIRDLRPPEPYKGKGVRYQGEKIRQKAGKSGKVGGKGKK